MNKMVKYNGGRSSHCVCTAPLELTVGQMYLVEEEAKYGYQTILKLKGIEGWFDANWFDAVNAFMAMSTFVPVVGTRLPCTRILSDGHGGICQIDCTTSTVKTVVKFGDLYMVSTQNNLYIVQMM
ncbi:MAG: hypothetical protein IJ215_01375 [Clostridia bacterium]|nr:hypothetical protein [Clostridia bacterium]